MFVWACMGLSFHFFKNLTPLFDIFPSILRKKENKNKKIRRASFFLRKNKNSADGSPARFRPRGRASEASILFVFLLEGKGIISAPRRARLYILPRREYVAPRSPPGVI